MKFCKHETLKSVLSTTLSTHFKEKNQCNTLRIKKIFFVSFLLISPWFHVSPSLSLPYSLSLSFSLSINLSLSLFASIYILLLTPFPSIYLSNYLSFSCRKSLKRFKEYVRGNIGMFGSRNFHLESYLRSCFHFGINCVGSLGQNGKRSILSFSQNVRSRVPNVHHHL